MSRRNSGTSVPCIAGINISYQWFSDIYKWSRRAVRYGNTDTLTAAYAGIAFGGVIKIILVFVFHHLCCPGLVIVGSPGNVPVFHDDTFVFPVHHVGRRIASPVGHPVAFVAGGVISYIGVYRITIYENGRITGIKHISILVKSQEGIPCLAFCEFFLDRYPKLFAFQAVRDGRSCLHRERKKCNCQNPGQNFLSFHKKVLLSFLDGHAC